MTWELDTPSGAYHKSVQRFQKVFANLADQLKRQNRPAIFIFEGWGAAGKGDIIRLVTARLNPRFYSVHAYHQPAGVDANHHYLWRYWRLIPERGHLAVFDRSWYRRVLIDRIEAACSEEEWRRAYQEINQTERQFIDFGGLLAKFWLQISPDEQLRRFESRANDASQRWKVSSDDWQRRYKWAEYQSAVDDMLAGTSTVYAPWTIIDSDSKPNAHLQTFQSLIKLFSDELKYNPLARAGKLKQVKKKRKQKQA